MLSKSKNLVPEFLSFALVLVFMLFYYSKLLFHPNSYLTVGDGDGIKAFYVFASHIKNSLHYNQFEGMNYPYGQTHIFTDGQTVIAILFKLLSRWIPFFNSYSMGIYNVFMLMSYPLCALIIANIFKRMHLPLFFIVAGSFAITIMSPQYFRLFGHPTLSYVLFVPLMWWLLIKYKASEKKLKWSLIILCNAVLWFFIHPYYIMLTVFFTIAYFVVEWLQSDKKKLFVKKELLFLILQTVVPLLITRVYVMIYDIHQFRSESPYGFWDYYAQWTTVFMPNHPPFASVMRKLFFPNGAQHWEGWAYVGMPAVFVALFSLFKIVKYIFRKKLSLIGKPVLPKELKTAVWASYIILLFSMCLPFQLGMHFLVDWFSFLKQFRSLGRFAWVFYYIFSVYAVYVLYLTYRKLHMRKFTIAAYVLVIAYFTIQVAEAFPYHNEGKLTISQSPNFFNKKYLPVYYKELITEINSIKSNYQCMIPLPFYHVGSENFGKEYTPLAIQSSMVASYWTNMPLLSSSAARSPILESKNIMQLFSPAFFKKEIEKDLSSKKDFLILYDKENLTDVEQMWYNKSILQWGNDRFELRALKYNDAFDFDAQKEKDFLMSGFKNYMPCLSDSPDKVSQVIVSENFDTLKSEQTFLGAGALQGAKKGFTFLLKKGNYNLSAEKEYVVGFWYYNKDELRTQATCIIEQCDADGSNCNWDVMWSPGESMTIAGDWSYVQKKFKPQKTGGQISVFINGDKFSNQQLFMDEFSLREINAVHIDTATAPAKMNEQQMAAYNDYVESIIKRIQSDTKWLSDVKAKAIKNNVSLDTMLRMDAIWVMEHEKKK